MPTKPTTCVDAVIRTVSYDTDRGEGEGVTKIP